MSTALSSALLFTPSSLNGIGRAFRNFLANKPSGQDIQEFRGFLHGEGLEFEELAQYTTGDDIRRIDWKVTARAQHPHVRRFREQRSRPVTIALDTSASMFASQGRMDRALHVLILLTRLAQLSHCPLRIVLFDEDCYAILPAALSRSLSKVRRFLSDSMRRDRGTHFERSMKSLLRRVRKQSVCFLLSDYFDERAPESLRIVSKQHVVAPLHILSDTDCSTVHLPRYLMLAARDAESGERRVVGAETLSSASAIGEALKSKARMNKRLSAPHAIGTQVSEDVRAALRTSRTSTMR